MRNAQSITALVPIQRDRERTGASGKEIGRSIRIAHQDRSRHEGCCRCLLQVGHSKTRRTQTRRVILAGDSQRDRRTLRRSSVAVVQGQSQRPARHRIIRAIGEGQAFDHPLGDRRCYLDGVRIQIQSDDEIGRNARRTRADGLPGRTGVMPHIIARSADIPDRRDYRRTRQRHRIAGREAAHSQSASIVVGTVLLRHCHVRVQHRRRRIDGVLEEGGSIQASDCRLVIRSREADRACCRHTRRRSTTVRVRIHYHPTHCPTRTARRGIFRRRSVGHGPQCRLVIGQRRCPRQRQHSRPRYVRPTDPSQRSEVQYISAGETSADGYRRSSNLRVIGVTHAHSAVDRSCYTILRVAQCSTGHQHRRIIPCSNVDGARHRHTCRSPSPVRVRIGHTPGHRPTRTARRWIFRGRSIRHALQGGLIIYHGRRARQGQYARVRIVASGDPVLVRETQHISGGETRTDCHRRPDNLRIIGVGNSERGSNCRCSTVLRVSQRPSSHHHRNLVHRRDDDGARHRGRQRGGL